MSDDGAAEADFVLGKQRITGKNKKIIHLFGFSLEKHYFCGLKTRRSTKQ